MLIKKFLHIITLKTANKHQKSDGVGEFLFVSTSTSFYSYKLLQLLQVIHTLGTNPKILEIAAAQVIRGPSLPNGAYSSMKPATPRK